MKIIWTDSGLKEAAAHHGHELTTEQCRIWTAAFKVNNPGIAAVKIGAATGRFATGEIAVMGRRSNGHMVTVIAPLFA